MPHPPDVAEVNCATCHADVVSGLGGSSHGAKLKAKLDAASKEGKAKLSEICLACHGTDVHSVRKTDDPQSLVAHANVYKTCLKCHDQVEPVLIKDYVNSIHGKAVISGNPKAAVCTDCHGSHEINHSRLANSKAARTNIPDTCGQCHKTESGEYTNSIHWQAAKQGFQDAPVCTDCHGEHEIRSRHDRNSATFSSNITETCARCHGSQVINTRFKLANNRVQTYMQSYHGLSGSLGNLKVANCASCHEAHQILPSSDLKSSVNPANLGKTCGKCHPGAEKRFIAEPIHKT